MTFFKDLSKKITDTAKEAAKKSSELMEITRLSMQADKEQKKIDNCLHEIGKLLYENYSEDNWAKEKFSNKFEEIKVIKQNIEEYKKEILKLKNLKSCSACNEEFNSNAGVCPECEDAGEIKADKNEAREENGETFIKCKTCSGYNSADSKFCSKCGGALV